MPGRYSIVAECAFLATTACWCCLSIMFRLAVKEIMIMVTTCTSCPAQYVHQHGLKLCHGDRYHRCWLSRSGVGRYFSTWYWSSISMALQYCTECGCFLNFGLLSMSSLTVVNEHRKRRSLPFVIETKQA